MLGTIVRSRSIRWRFPVTPVPLGEIVRRRTTRDQRGWIVAAKFEVYKDARGEYRFRLKAPNGQIIASSEGYKSKDSALNGVASVQKNAADALVDDQS